MKQFTASEVRDCIAYFYGDKLTRISAMLTAFADLLEAREQAVPVAWRVANHPHGPFDFRSRKPIGWAVMEPLYTHPQPVQDAKDAARYRHMIETSPFMCFGASEYHKKSDLDEAIDNSIAAMAKESRR